MTEYIKMGLSDFVMFALWSLFIYLLKNACTRLVFQNTYVWKCMNKEHFLDLLEVRLKRTMMSTVLLLSFSLNVALFPRWRIIFMWSNWEQPDLSYKNAFLFFSKLLTKNYLILLRSMTEYAKFQTQTIFKLWRHAHDLEKSYHHRMCTLGGSLD